MRRGVDYVFRQSAFKGGYIEVGASCTSTMQAPQHGPGANVLHGQSTGSGSRDRLVPSGGGAYLLNLTGSRSLAREMRMAVIKQARQICSTHQCLSASSVFFAVTRTFLWRELMHLHTTLRCALPAQSLGLVARCHQAL